jgi:hypothetical protein
MGVEIPIIASHLTQKWAFRTGSFVPDHFVTALTVSKRERAHMPAKRPRRRSEGVEELYTTLSENELGYKPVPLRAMPLDPRCVANERASRARTPLVRDCDERARPFPYAGMRAE